MTPEVRDGLAVIEHGPSAVGARLVAARERMGWTLPDVAATLRIREPHLRAIEAGHVAELPAPAYAIGFVRSYATLLGLDPDEIARRYRDELGGEHRNTDLQFPAPVPERGVPAGAVVLLGAVIAIGAYIGWYRLSGERPAPAPVVAAPDRLVAPAVVAPMPAGPTASAAPTPAAPTASVPTASVPTASVPATKPLLQTAEREVPPAPPPTSPAATSPAATSPAATTPAPTTATAPEASPASRAEESPPETRASANPAPSTSPAAPAGALAAEMPPPAASPAPASALADDSHILLRARADSWVEVHDRKGRVLLSRILHSGETWAVPNQPEGAPQLLLTTGNAGGTEIVIDGTPAPPLGGEGKVRRDLPLDPALILNRKPAANSVPHPSSPAQ